MATRLRDFTPERIYFITFTIYKWIQIYTEEKYFYLVYKWFDHIDDRQSPGKAPETLTGG